MGHRRVFFSVVAVLSLPLGCPGQQAPVRDPQAVTLLTTAYVKLGGQTSSKLADVTLSGWLASPDSPDASVGSFVAKARGSDFSVETTWHSGKHSKFCVLKGRGSVRTDGKMRPLPPHNTNGLTLDIFLLFGRWTDFLGSEVTVRSEGEIALDGASYQLVRVESNQPSQDPRQINDYGKSDVVIDPRTGLIASIRYAASYGIFFSSRIHVENRFDDYRVLSGMLVPRKITRYLNGQPQFVLHVESVVINAGQTDADFHN